MKKTIYTLFVMLLVGGLVAMGQIKPIKRQHSTKRNTEQTLKKPKQSSPSISSKSIKTTKTITQQSSNRSSQTSSMERTQMDPIIQQAIEDMVWVEGGTFMMGAVDAYDREKPIHQVTLSGYFISKYEVTQELWQVVMDSNPSHFSGDTRHPVECVSWEDCQVFISKLNQLTSKQFRLPTEAEWEFAARGGNQSHGYKYSGSDDGYDVAWNEGNCVNTTNPVGALAPNELGLYDMSGNVWEWCNDWYDSYDSSSQTDPTGPSFGSSRVSRGGCWHNFISYCRVSIRSEIEPNYTWGDVGLRLVASSL